MQSSAELADIGALLALRALGWGTVYAVSGTGLICYGIWKLSGAKDVSLLFIYTNKVYIYKILLSYLCIRLCFVKKALLHHNPN